MTAVDTEPGDVTLHRHRLGPGELPSEPDLDDEKTATRTGRLPNVLLIVSIGIFLVAYAYARGREELGFGTLLYWTGQVLIFAPVMYCVLAPSTLRYQREVLVFTYAGAQSMIRWAYSPQRFTFIDELQHERALNNVLDSGHLFHENYSLPVSGHYPGLESIAAQFSQITNLGTFPAGVTVATATHLLTAGCILILFREISRSSYIAAVGTLIYMLNPHASFFNTSFLYEAPALPFGMIAVLFAIRFATRPRERAVYFWGLLVSVALIVITHHVTALSIVAILAAVTLTTLCVRRARSLTIPLLVCTFGALLVVAVWIFGVAPVTIDYLGVPVKDLVQSIGMFVTGQSTLSLPGPPTPLIDRLIGPLGVLLTLVLTIANLRAVRMRRPVEECWTWLALITYGAASVIRVLVSSGAELAGRLLTYAAIFSALVVGTALVRMVAAPFGGSAPDASAFRRLVTLSWLRRVITATQLRRLATATTFSVVLLLSSIMTSLPAWYQRVPGGFWIEGFAGGIDNVGISRAEWVAKHIHPGMRYSGDIASMWLLSTIGKLDPVKDPGTIYYSDPSDTFTDDEIDHIKNFGIVMVDVDMRMAKYMPIGNRYFVTDVNGGKLEKPIDVERLEKFDNIAGLSRVYDSGYARIYDMRGGRNAPYAR
jgi:hypothetical protein